MYTGMCSDRLIKEIKELKYDDNFYADVYTLDPSEVEYAWEKLTVSQTLITLKFLPQSIALAFVDTLKERGHLR